MFMKPFLIQKIKKNIYLIKETFYRECANIYLFRHKDKCLLFDCGLGFFNLKKFLIDNGYRFFTVVITHGHFDHAGGLNHFNKEEIIINQHQKTALQDTKNLGLKYLNPKDFIGINEKKAINFCKNFCIKKKSLSLYANKNTFSFFDYNFQLIETPGHSNDSICFYENQRQILLTGDTLYDGMLYYNFPNYSSAMLNKSLDYISNCKIKLILPGHNQILTNNKIQLAIKKWKNILSA